MWQAGPTLPGMAISLLRTDIRLLSEGREEITELRSLDGEGSQKINDDANNIRGTFSSSARG